MFTSTVRVSVVRHVSPFVRCAAVLALGASSLSAQSFQGLGFLPTAASSAARAISSDGSVVVGDSGPAFAGVGFRWSSATGMQSVGPLAGGTYLFAPSVSGDGTTITGYGDTPVGQRAYRWTSATGFVDLGALPGSTQVLGSDASADGSVIVGVSGSVGGYRAFRWTSAGGIQNLGTLPGGAISFGYSVNADGSVVVGDSDSTIGDVAFRWTSAGGMQSLGALPGGTFSYGYAVSADGLVVVGDSDSSVGDVAYRWTASTGMVSLGTLPAPFAYMVSNAVDADGSAIVGATVGGTGTAFLWTSTLGIVDLNSYLPTLGINLTGWTLTDGGAISADGRTIAGTGIHNGVEEAWVATLQGATATPYCSGDGSGLACPCANNGAVGNGCASSINAGGAKLSASGIASVSGDTWLLSGTGTPNGPGLYFQGVTQLGGGLGVVFGDGLRCVGGTVIRLGVVTASANASTYPSPNPPATNQTVISIKGFCTPGAVRDYQLWYRDSAAGFCTASTFNLTNALNITWSP